MRCQEAGFMQARCRIEVEPRDVPDGAPPFKARVFVVEDDAVRAITFADGRAAEIPGETEALAVNAALAFLSARFGSLTEYTHDCMSDASRTGDPLVIAD